MQYTSTIDHESRTEADVVKTTHKWYLPFWSLLSNYYGQGINSAPFDVMEGENCTCTLKFWPTKQLTVQFDGELEQRHSIQASISFVDENMKELYKLKSGTVSSALQLPPFYLKDDPAYYLQNDTLILYFVLWIVTAVHETPSLTSNITNKRELNFSGISNRAKIEDMYDNGQFCDVTFVVQDKKLTGHKLILSANSDVFKAMFTTGMKEEKEGLVKIEDVDAKIFEKLLKFMYTGKVENIDVIASELIVVASRYQVIDLMRLCETYMKSHLSVDNATEYLLIAHQMVCSSLEDKAIEFLRSNTKILADAAELKLLSDYPSLISRIFG